MNSEVEKTLLQSLETIRKLNSKIKEYESNEREDIAIIGMSCRFPGAANSVDDFWKNLVNGKSAIRDMGNERWSKEEFFQDDAPSEGMRPGKTLTHYAGSLDNVYDFDAGFFGLSQVETQNLDPQQRILLEQSWLAIEDAGVAATDIRSSNTGVFIGVSSNDYGQALMSDINAVNAYVASGNSPSMAAGRLAYFYDFIGPVITVDTACSSSLVALNLAHEKLKSGNCDLALVGGVNAILTPSASINFSQAQMLTSNDNPHVFDDRANGYIRGEGCGVIVLKTLTKAIADGDRIYAVVKGVAENHDGRTSGLTVPNGPSQEKVILAALNKAGVSAEDISYVEAHGTGTSLGDPIEANALSKALGSSNKSDNHIYVGSVKANIGHLEAAAGIAGIIKTALVVSRRLAPPQVGYESLNKNITWDTARFSVPRKPQHIDKETVTAGVSSFGFSGTNAHAIVASAPALENSDKSDSQAGPNILSVSAKTPDALASLLTKLSSYLSEKDDKDLGSICQTSLYRRALQNEKVAFVGKDIEELKNKIDAYGFAVSQEHANKNLVLVLSMHDSAKTIIEGIDQLGRIGKQVLDASDAQFEKACNMTRDTLFEIESEENRSLQLCFAHRALLATLNELGLLYRYIVFDGLSAEHLIQPWENGDFQYDKSYVNTESTQAYTYNVEYASLGNYYPNLERCLSVISDACIVSALEESKLSRVCSDPQKYIAVGNKLVSSLVDLFNYGFTFDLRLLYSNRGAFAADFPKYSFIRRKYISPIIQNFNQGNSLQAKAQSHVLFKDVVSLPEGKDVYRIELTKQDKALLDQHRVNGQRILPASLSIELFQAALRERYGDENYALSDINFLLPIDVDAAEEIQLTLDANDDQAELSLWCSNKASNSCANSQKKWRHHAVVKVKLEERKSQPLEYETENSKEEGVQECDIEGLYEQHASNNIVLGDAFRVLASLSRENNKAQGRATIKVDSHTLSIQHQFNTIVLDACFQAGSVLRENNNEDYLLASVESCELALRPSDEIRVVFHKVSEDLGKSYNLDLDVYDYNNILLGKIRGACFKRFIMSGGSNGSELKNNCYVQRWSNLYPLTDVLPKEYAVSSAFRLLDEDIVSENNLPRYLSFRPELEKLCEYYVENSLYSLANGKADQWFAKDVLAATLGVIPEQESLFEYFVNYLVKQGRIEISSDGKKVLFCAGIEHTSPLKDLEQSYPDYEHEVRFIERCGIHLTAVFEGREDPLNILFSDKSLAGSEAVYRESPISKVLNHQMATLLEQFCQGKKRINILEIGAGTGGTTQDVIQSLPADAIERYVFTDISPLFLERAKKNFSQYSYMKYFLLDIEKDVVEQGFDTESFDILIASNVLHATKSMRETLTHIETLLAPQGVLLIREAIIPQLGADISFGMTSGWWRFEDSDIRTDYPLVSVKTWRSLFSDTGFYRTEVYVPGINSTEGILCTQKIEQNSRKLWLIVHAGDEFSTSVCDKLGHDACTVWEMDKTLSYIQQERAIQDKIKREKQEFDYVLIFPLREQSNGDILQSARRSYESHIQVCKELSGFQGVENAKFWCVTHNAIQTEDTDLLSGLDSCVMHGVMKAFFAEYYQYAGGVLDLDSEDDESAIGLIAHIRRPGGENYVSLRNGIIKSARLESFQADLVSPLEAIEGAALITGGLGGVGYVLAKHYASYGASHLILLGRSFSGEVKKSKLKSLGKYGCEVLCIETDLAIESEVEFVFSELKRLNINLQHIVHAAGVGDDREWPTIAVGDGREVIGAKLTGAWYLHKYSESMPIKTFSIASTMVSLWGTRNKVHYTLANVFADSLCAYRRAHGLPASSLQLGPLDLGMLSIEDKKAAEDMGFQCFKERDVVEAFSLAPKQDEAVMAIIRADWQKVAQVFERTWLGPLFSSLKGHEHSDSLSSVTKEDSFDLLNVYKNSKKSARASLVKESIIDVLINVLGDTLSKNQLNSMGFHDMGMDSLLTISFSEKLTKKFSLKISSIDVFDRANVSGLGEWLNALLNEQLQSASANPLAVENTAPAKKEAADQNNESPDENVDGDDLDDDLLAIESLLEEF